jgi:hypothetical protein
VVDGNGLENRRTSNGTVGSNPTPSAKIESMDTHTLQQYVIDNRQAGIGDIAITASLQAAGYPAGLIRSALDYHTTYSQWQLLRIGLAAQIISRG